jgi:putative endonuclease
MRDEFQPTTYVLASRRYGTLYTGVTSNVMLRIYEHKEQVFKGFATEKNTKILVWFEQHGTMETAIQREKRIKKWNRQWKINLIEANNPAWRDLSVDFGFPMLPTQFLTNEPLALDSRLRGNEEVWMMA